MGAKCLPRIETTDLIKVLGDVAEEHEIYLSEIHSGRGERPFWGEVTRSLNDIYEPHPDYAYLKPVNVHVLVRKNWKRLYSELIKLLPEHQIDL